MMTYPQTTGPLAVIPVADLQAMIDSAVAKALTAHTPRPPHMLRPVSVTRKDAAAMLGLSPPTVTAMVKKGILTLDGTGRISIDSIDAAINEGMGK
jgi:CRP-like cAMP-binding protein